MTIPKNRNMVNSHAYVMDNFEDLRNWDTEDIMSIKEDLLMESERRGYYDNW